VLVSCGSRYPLKTCVVCDQSLEKHGGPISFIHKGQKVEACSEEHRAEFNKEPNRYLEKIKEVKVL
jgi:YHS domain-containing protein